MALFALPRMPLALPAITLGHIMTLIPFPSFSLILHPHPSVCNTRSTKMKQGKKKPTNPPSNLTASFLMENWSKTGKKKKKTKAT